MRLYLKRKQETQGLLTRKTVYRVESRLVCSEEERRAINTLGIENYECVERYTFDKVEYGSFKCGQWASDGVWFPIEKLVNAHDIERQLRDQAHTVNDLVKTFIAEGAQTEMEETIEL